MSPIRALIAKYLRRFLAAMILITLLTILGIQLYLADYVDVHCNAALASGEVVDLGKEDCLAQNNAFLGRNQSEILMNESAHIWQVTDGYPDGHCKQVPLGRIRQRAICEKIDYGWINLWHILFFATVAFVGWVASTWWRRHKAMLKLEELRKKGFNETDPEDDPINHKDVREPGKKKGRKTSRRKRSSKKSKRKSRKS